MPLIGSQESLTDSVPQFHKYSVSIAPDLRQYIISSIHLLLLINDWTKTRLILWKPILLLSAGQWAEISSLPASNCRDAELLLKAGGQQYLPSPSQPFLTASLFHLSGLSLDLSKVQYSFYQLSLKFLRRIYFQ